MSIELKRKVVYTTKSMSVVKLTYDGHFFDVKVDNETYKKTANVLFAVQAFNEI